MRHKKESAASIEHIDANINEMINLQDVSSNDNKIYLNVHTKKTNNNYKPVLSNPDATGTRQKKKNA